MSRDDDSDCNCGERICGTEGDWGRGEDTPTRRPTALGPRLRLQSQNKGEIAPIAFGKGDRGGGRERERGLNRLITEGRGEVVGIATVLECLAFLGRLSH